MNNIYLTLGVVVIVSMFGLLFIGYGIDRTNESMKQYCRNKYGENAFIEQTNKQTNCVVYKKGIKEYKELGIHIMYPFSTNIYKGVEVNG